jgi:hypothetical protein
MSCQDNQANINETFIIEPIFVGSDSISACTSVYTNEIISCSGDSSIMMSQGVIIFNGNLYTNDSLTANTINASTYFSGGTNLLDIFGGSDIYLTGGTFNPETNTLSLFNSNDTIINVTGFTSDKITGGTFFGNSLLLNTNAGEVINISGYTNIYNSNGELNDDRTVNAGDFYLRFSTSQDENNLVVKNGRVGVGNLNPDTTFHVTDGTSGAMNMGLYESAVIENEGDTKFGIYTSSNNFPIGGVSILLGHNNLTNNSGLYPGIEFQYYTPNSSPSSSQVRYNFVQRTSGGLVSTFVSDLFKVESTGVVTMNPNNNGTSINVTPKLGIGTSSPRVNSILDLTSTNSGLLPPRMSTTERNSVVWTSLDAGMLIYNNTTNSLNYRNQSNWVDLNGIDNDTFITGGTFNGSVLTLNSNSGTSVVVTGFTSPTTDWSTTGNTGTTGTTNFIGTIDDQPLVFRTNNFERVRILGGADNVGTVQFNSQGSPYLTFARVANNGASINAGQNNELFLANTANGRVHIGTDALGNQNSALLQLRSTTRGFLLPRQTTTERNAIASPATGLMIYDTSVNKVSVYNGTSWRYLQYEP